jgi:hypothetical protein
MSKQLFVTLCMLLVAGTALIAGPASAADRYEVVVEYNGPYFHAVNAPGVNQLSDDPLKEYTFENAYGVAVSVEPGGRIMNYVLDSGNRRILGYETNVDIGHLGNTSAGVTYTDPRVAANQWDDQGINLSEWIAVATKWLVPLSEVFKVNGETWGYVASVAGYTSADHVYTIDYDDTSNSPELRVPTGALSSTDAWELTYAISNYRGGGTAAYGLGEVDQGNSDAASITDVLVNQTAPVTKSFQDLRDVYTITNQTTATTDELWLVDAADNSVAQNEELMVYTVTQATGVEAFLEAYDDVLDEPSDVFVAKNATDTYTAPTWTALAGVAHFTTAALVDANQVTGHTYSIDMTGALVTITDLTTGRKLVDGAAKTDFVTGTNTCYIIPGLGVDFEVAVANDTDATFATHRAVPSRYAFVCDRGNDRIKVIGVPDISTSTGDDLPGDAHTCAVQPAGVGTVGATQDEDYRFSTPASVPPNWKTGTLTRPIKEGSLETLIEDPAGTPITWTRVDDLATAGPADKVFQLDWWEGVILFGDGMRGALPTASTAFEMTYTTTPDVMRYGSNGSGHGQFADPGAVCAIWNAGLGCYAVYVADTGNNRIQKFNFFPEDLALRIPPRMEYVCEWTEVTGPDDLLTGPREIDAATNGTSYYIAVGDASNRVIVYKDAGFFTTGAAAPDYEVAVGGTGTEIGGFASIDGLDLVRSGSEVELYVADGERDVVTKFVLAPQASITLAFTSVSALPNSFPPTGSYTISYTVANAPADAYVDFYFSPQAVWSESSADLCFTAGSKGTDLGTVKWLFSSSPDGRPADGTYYLHAILRDGMGNALASDAANSSELLSIDSNLTTSLRARDMHDGDPTLLAAPNQDKTVSLELTYPDSVIGASFVGTFPSDFFEIVNIVPGPGWEGTDYLQHVWNATYDNEAGTYSVMTSILGSPVGLSASGVQPMAYVTLRPRTGALSGSTRVLDGAFDLNAAQCNITDKDGAQPAGWVTRSLDTYLAYVGDIANATTGTDSVVPYLQPRPDGYMTFADQMAFTRGWNGLNNVRDMISDIGPVDGAAPNLTPAPDGKYDIGDVLAFTGNWSWFAGNGYGITTAADGIGLNAFSPLGAPVDGAPVVDVTASGTALPGETILVDVTAGAVTGLTGAMVRITYDPAELTLLGVERGELLDAEGATQLFNTIERDGVVEICVSRLDPEHPGASGSGSIASLTFAVSAAPEHGLACAYDLRDWKDQVIERGTKEIFSVTSGNPASVVLCQNYPNPLNPGTSIVFSLPERNAVDLAVYDLAGRRVKTLVHGSRDAGVHAFDWSGYDEAGARVASGVYFYKLTVGDVTQTRKLVVTR